MNHTTKFSLSTAAEGQFAQTAFFMFVGDFARLTARGKSAKAAFEQAKRSVELLGLSDAETDQFDLLMLNFCSDQFVETEFLLDGRTRTAKVSWLSIDLYPTANLLN